MTPDLPAAAADLRVGERFASRRYGEVEVIEVERREPGFVRFRAVGSEGRPEQYVYELLTQAFLATLERRA